MDTSKTDQKHRFVAYIKNEISYLTATRTETSSSSMFGISSKICNKITCVNSHTWFLTHTFI